MIRTTITIDGMACSMCEAHMTETVRKAVPDAKKITASHKKGEVAFLTEGEVDTEKLKEAIDATGYRAVSFASEPYLKKGLFHR